jgi:hypothetical protein
VGAGVGSAVGRGVGSAVGRLVGVGSGVGVGVGDGVNEATATLLATALGEADGDSTTSPLGSSRTPTTRRIAMTMRAIEVSRQRRRRGLTPWAGSTAAGSIGCAWERSAIGRPVLDAIPIRRRIVSGVWGWTSPASGALGADRRNRSRMA